MYHSKNIPMFADTCPLHGIYQNIFHEGIVCCLIMFHTYADNPSLDFEWILDRKNAVTMWTSDEQKMSWKQISAALNRLCPMLIEWSTRRNNHSYGIWCNLRLRAKSDFIDNPNYSEILTKNSQSHQNILGKHDRNLIKLPILLPISQNWLICKIGKT